MVAQFLERQLKNSNREKLRILLAGNPPNPWEENLQTDARKTSKPMGRTLIISKTLGNFKVAVAAVAAAIAVAVITVLVSLSSPSPPSPSLVKASFILVVLLSAAGGGGAVAVAFYHLVIIVMQMH